MAIGIIDVLQGGIERTVARNGLLFVALFFALGVINTLVTIPLGGAPGSGPPVEGAPILGALFGALISLASALLFIGALRTFVHGEIERVPQEFFTRNVFWALLNLLVGGIVFGIVVALGLIALVLPGLLLLVSLFFWNAHEQEQPR